MDRVPARVLAKGRVTIPADKREELGLEHGDKVWIHVERRGEGTELEAIRRRHRDGRD